VDLLRTQLHERLRTTDQVKAAASRIKVSPATLYRWKAAPETIPFGKVAMLIDYLGDPVQDRVSWSRSEFVASDRRRLELERATSPGGTRYVVTPTFTVNSELPELTERLLEYDYGARYRDRLPEYLEVREARRQLYESGDYTSYEMINGASYLDFHSGRGRYDGVPRSLRESQIKELLRSLRFAHVRRRIYLKSTPELPIVSCYNGPGTSTAVIRVDDFTVECRGEQIASELQEIFMEYFERADLKSPEQVAEFLRSGGTP
jgi:hypothetical protein